LGLSQSLDVTCNHCIGWSDITVICGCSVMGGNIVYCVKMRSGVLCEVTILVKFYSSRLSKVKSILVCAVEWTTICRHNHNH